MSSPFLVPQDAPAVEVEAGAWGVFFEARAQWESSEDSSSFGADAWIARSLSLARAAVAMEALEPAGPSSPERFAQRLDLHFIGGLWLAGGPASQAALAYLRSVPSLQSLEGPYFAPPATAVAMHSFVELPLAGALRKLAAHFELCALHGVEAGEPLQWPFDRAQSERWIKVQQERRALAAGLASGPEILRARSGASRAL